ncbi:molecular chaperone [Salmonella enterica]|nr:molecular chaperone [Salmonella enterica]
MPVLVMSWLAGGRMKLRWGNVLLCVLSMLASEAQATPVGSGGIGLNATRVVFTPGESVSVGVRNTTTSPYLVQSYVIDEQKHIVKGLSVSPALTRVEAGATSMLRIAGKPIERSVPSDRETMFYFMSKGIAQSNPLSPDRDGALSAGVKIGLGNQIKFFYRPVGLDAEGAELAGKNVVFRRTVGGVKVENASPYYVSLKGVRFGPKKGGKKISLLNKPMLGTLPPYSTTMYSVAETGQFPDVTWGVLDDIGALHIYQGGVQ